MNTLDDRDRAIIAERVQSLDLIPGPRVGDFVDFADGTVRRISHIWGDGDDPDLDTVQTSDERAGSYHLGGTRRGLVQHGVGAHVSYSGGLHHGVPHASLTRTGQTRPGRVWIFHHDRWVKDGAVHAEVPFRVYACPLDPT